MENEVLSRNLKNLREKNGYLQKFVADKLGVRSNTLSGYENGTRSPDPEMLVRIAELYNVSIDFLLGREKEVYSLQYYKNKIVTEFPDIDLMFKDMESLTADDMKEVYDYIKFKKSQKEKWGDDLIG